MPINDEKLYEEIGQAWRHFASWREKIFAGYLTTVAALAVGYFQNASVFLRAAIFAGGVLVSVVFWMLEFRNVQLINACQMAADRLEHGKGCYAELNRLRFDRKTFLTYSAAISLLAIAISAYCFGGFCLYVVRSWQSGTIVWPLFAAGIFGLAVSIFLKRLLDQRMSGDEALYRAAASEQEHP